MRRRLALLCAVPLLALATPCDAQRLFGQNKVVYESRQWRVLEHGRVRVHFYPEEAELARFTLGVAVRAYDEFALWFDHDFDEPIPLVLYGTHHDLKQTHVIPNFVSEGTAGFTEFAKGRIAVRATGSRAELEHLVRHELVHAFMLSKLAAVMSQRRIYDYEGPPLWFIEGLAESVARTGIDRQAEMVLRDAALHDGLVPLPEMWRIWGTFQMYKQGESLVDHLRLQYGDRVPVLLLENWWRGRDFEEVLRLELGLDVEGLDRQWRNALKRRWFPEFERRRPAEEQSRALDPRAWFATVPSFVDRDDEGTLRLVGVAAREGTLGLYELRVPVRGEPRWERLVEGGRKARFESLPQLRSRLDVLDARWVAFVAKHGGRDALFVYDLQERAVVEEYASEEVVEISSPAFSPDRERLAFSGLDRGGAGGLYVVERSTGHIRFLTRGAGHDVDPDWDPSGERLVFSSDRGDRSRGRHSLYTVDLSAPHAVTLLFDSGGHDTQPRFDPTGERVVFVSDVDGAADLHVLDLPRARARAWSNLTGGAFAPDFDDAGETIVACVFQEGRFRYHLFDRGALPQTPERVGREPEGGADPGAREELITAAVERDYDVDLGLDFVQSVVALDPDLPYGSGASLGFTDLLGDHQVFAHLSTATEEFSLEDLNAGMSYSNLGSRWNKHVGVFRVAVRPQLRGFGRQQYSEVRTGAFAGLTYPISRFRRVEATTVVRHLQRDASLQLPGEPGDSWLASLFLSFVHDNSLWTWQGPVRGSRWNVTLGETVDLLDRGFDRRTVQVDLRRYDELGRQVVLAHRVAWRGSFGSDTQFFYLGGPNDLRGHEWFAFIGDRVTLLNSELRFPLIERLALRLPVADVELPPIRGVFFADVARVDGRLDDTGWIGAFGYGAAMTLIPPLVLRLDVARAHDFERAEAWDLDLSLSFLY